MCSSFRWWDEDKSQRFLCFIKIKTNIHDSWAYINYSDDGRIVRTLWVNLWKVILQWSDQQRDQLLIFSYENKNNFDCPFSDVMIILLFSEGPYCLFYLLLRFHIILLFLLFLFLLREKCYMGFLYQLSVVQFMGKFQRLLFIVTVTMEITGMTILCPFFREKIWNQMLWFNLLEGIQIAMPRYRNLSEAIRSMRALNMHKDKANHFIPYVGVNFYTFKVTGEGQYWISKEMKRKRKGHFTSHFCYQTLHRCTDKFLQSVSLKCTGRIVRNHGQ